MENDMIFSAGADMMYLAACAIHGVVPNKDTVEKMDLNAVYVQASRHYMQAVTYQAIDSYVKAYGNEAIISFEDILNSWKNDRIRAIKHTVSFEMEREKVFAFFEKNNIWYLPLKGIVIQEYYPSIGMRQMSDNDILYDLSYRFQLREYMFELGYEGKLLDSVFPDTYVKNSVAFEMHHSLYNDTKYEAFFYDYYKCISDRLVNAEEGVRRYLSEEDFYIYLVTHTYKHFRFYGTGVRSLMDVYVYLEFGKKLLDWEYINAELKKLGLLEFDEMQRKLSYITFSKDCINLNYSIDQVDAEGIELIKYYIDCGVYGSTENFVVNRFKPKFDNDNIKVDNKFKYLFERIFPNIEDYKQTYPFAYNHKILIPAAWFLRLLKGILLKSSKIFRELKIVVKTK